MNRCVPLWFAAAALLLPVAVQAANPSTDDIINALKPNPASLSGPTRGIRAISPGTQPGASTAPAATGDAVNPSLDMSIQFRSGSADLTPAATATLDNLGRALSSSALSSYKFRIEGHTDTVGGADANQTLSTRRAESVAAYLESKYGVSSSRLDAVGMGERDLLVSTPDQTAEPRNRRVHIVNLGA